MLLFLAIYFLFFESGSGCFSTSTNDATPEVPILPCTTCTLPITSNPPGGFGDQLEEGLASQTMGTVGPGCTTFTVTCESRDGEVRDVAIAGITDGTPAPIVNGRSTVSQQFVCNEEGNVEGPTGIVDEVFCAQTTFIIN